MSMIFEKLKPNTKYQFKISAKNGIDTGPATDWTDMVQTLNEDPVFIPKVEVKGSSHATITIGWQPPPPELLDYIHFYEVVVFQENNTHVEKASSENSIFWRLTTFFNIFLKRPIMPRTRGISLTWLTTSKLQQITSLKSVLAMSIHPSVAIGLKWLMARPWMVSLVRHLMFE